MTILTDDELSTIHDMSLQMLSTIGFRVESQSALEMIRRSGVDVDVPSRTVKISESVMRDCLRSAPKANSVILCDRNKKPYMRFGSDKTYAFSGFDALQFVDQQTRIRKPLTTLDVANFARLADGLEEIDGVGTPGIPQDVPPAVSEIIGAEALFLNTTKHIELGPFSARTARAIFEMAKVVSGVDDLRKAQILHIMAGAQSPLKLSKEDAEMLIECSLNGLLCNLSTQPMTGVTCPVSLIGTLLACNIEVLSGLAITQLANKGSPVAYGYTPAVFNMREGTPVIAAPETAALRIASIQLARFYDLPCHSFAPDSDSQCEDEQCGWEKMVTTMTAMSARPDMILNAGMFGTGTSISLEQLVIDDEIIGYVRRLIRGIDEDPELLMADLMKKVGFDGHYLKEKQTAIHFKREHWIPVISNRSSFTRWANQGSMDVVTKAKKREERILAEHYPEPLDKQIQEKLREIIRRFERTSRPASENY